MKIFNTTPREDGFRMPGEFEPHQGCIMIWPVRPGSWIYGGKAAKKVFAKIANIISESEHVYVLTDHEHLIEAQEHLKEAQEHLIEAQEHLIEAQEHLIETQKYLKESQAYLYEACDSAEETDGFLMDFRGQLNGMQEHRKKNRENINKPIPSCKGIEVVEIESDDAWARDVAPTFVKNDKGVVRGINWSFNAWGGDYDGLYKSWDKDNRVAKSFLEYTGYDCYDAEPFVLEGGSIHSDGDGTLIVTESCLCSPGRNPKLTKQQIEEKLKQYCNVDKVVWLPCGIYQDETNEHVDNVCAFVRPGEVVLAWTNDESDPQYRMSEACIQVLERETDAKGRHFKVHKLLIPEKPVCITEEELAGFEFEPGEDERSAGERLAASYVNFYISNGAIVLPQFGDVNDKKAVDVLKEAFPDRKIVPVYARDIIVGGGNIHCITQQIPK